MAVRRERVLYLDACATFEEALKEVAEDRGEGVCCPQDKVVCQRQFQVQDIGDVTK
jgi:hypothetical protein